MQGTNETGPPQEDWLTPEELGWWLKVGRTKAYDLLRTGGGIPSVKIGRLRRIRRRDVEAWLERNKEQPGELGHHINKTAEGYWELQDKRSKRAGTAKELA